MAFQGCCSDHDYFPLQGEHAERLMRRMDFGVTSCKLLSVIGVKVFWMCPCHLVTIAETDRGAVGQSGVGVLNELSWIQTVSLSRGMDEWPDSLSTSLFLSLTFQPSLLLSSLSPPLSNFLTLLAPQNPYIVSFFNLSLPPASHFGCPLLPSSLVSQTSFFYSVISLCSPSPHFPSHLFKGLFFQQWAALTELQPCFHSERRSTYALCDPNFHPWRSFPLPRAPLSLSSLSSFPAYPLSLAPKGVLYAISANVTTRAFWRMYLFQIASAPA